MIIWHFFSCKLHISSYNVMKKFVISMLIYLPQWSGSILPLAINILPTLNQHLHNISQASNGCMVKGTISKLISLETKCWKFRNLNLNFCVFTPFSSHLIYIFMMFLDIFHIWVIYSIKPSWTSIGAFHWGYLASGVSCERHLGAKIRLYK